MYIYVVIVVYRIYIGSLNCEKVEWVCLEYLNFCIIYFVGVGVRLVFELWGFLGLIYSFL